MSKIHILRYVLMSRASINKYISMFYDSFLAELLFAAHRRLSGLINICFANNTLRSYYCSFCIFFMNIFHFSCATITCTGLLASFWSKENFRRYFTRFSNIRLSQGLMSFRFWFQNQENRAVVLAFWSPRDHFVQ